MTVHRKSTRLSPAHYRGRHAYFLSVCTDQRIPHFSSSTVSENTIRILLECAASQSFLLHAYCLMPDHIHVLIGGTTDTADATQFIRLFKQRTGYEFRKSGEQRLWEKTYYDHILRRGDSIASVACYIWWNPVRKNLCSHPSEFAFSGSLTMDWTQQSLAVPRWSAPWKSKKPA